MDALNSMTYSRSDEWRIYESAGDCAAWRNPKRRKTARRGWVWCVRTFAHVLYRSIGRFPRLDMMLASSQSWFERRETKLTPNRNERKHGTRPGDFVKLAGSVRQTSFRSHRKCIRSASEVERGCCTCRRNYATIAAGHVRDNCKSLHRIARH